MEELKEAVSRLTVPLAIALIGVVARVMFDAERLTLIRAVRTLIIGLTVGALAGLALGPIDIPAAHKGAIIGVASIVSEDVIAAIVQAGGRLRDDPLAFVRYLFKRR